MQHQDQPIKWNQIAALASLDAAILISWMAYHNYQPQLIRKFHFESLIDFVKITQTVVVLFIPLLAGYLTDKFKEKKGNWLTIFAIGISTASMIFMMVSYSISDHALASFVQYLPLMIIFWLISMNLFHSPANAIIETFSRSSYLTLIMAIIAMVKELIYVAEPVLLESLEGVGGSTTFFVGGLALIITGTYFGSATKNIHTEHHEEDINEKNNFLTVIIFGLLAGVAHGTILQLFPSILHHKLAGNNEHINHHTYVSVFFLIAALSSIPMSFLAKKYGIKLCLVISLFILFSSLLVLVLAEHVFVCEIFLLVAAMAYSMMAVTAFPYALFNINAKNATFGTGLFFASFEAFEIIIRLFI